MLALEEYFISKDQKIFSRLYECANAISTVGMPLLTRHEKILLRQTERKNLLDERFGVEVGSPRPEPQEVLGDASDGGSMSPHPFAESSGSSRQSYQTGRKLSSTSVQTTGARPTSGKRPRRGVPRDTHMFEAEAGFKGITVPIRIPMTVFDEDVGDVSWLE